MISPTVDFAILIVLAIVAMGLAWVVLDLYHRFNHLGEQRKWKSIDAHLLRADPKRDPDQATFRNGKPIYLVQLEYGFEIDGQYYTGSLFHSQTPLTQERATQIAIQKRGSRVRLRYNPVHPNEAIIDRGAGHEAEWIGSLFFLIIITMTFVTLTLMTIGWLVFLINWWVI